MITHNAGIDSGVIIDKILSQKSNTFGFNALTGKFVDMLEDGIIDPTKVTRSALENAASVAATLLTTEVLVCDIEEKNTTTPNPTAVPQGYGIY
jgi:chaperonin GroEL